MKNLIVGILIGICLCTFHYWRDKPYVIIENEIDLKSINLETLRGSPANLMEYKNETTYFYFWGTYCAPCIKKLPKLNAIACDSNKTIVCISAEDTGTINKYLDHFDYDCLNFLKVDEPFSEFGIRFIPKLIDVTSTDPKLLSRDDIDKLIAENLH